LLNSAFGIDEAAVTAWRDLGRVIPPILIAGTGWATIAPAPKQKIQ
jgi:hypothetical protein